MARVLRSPFALFVLLAFALCWLFWAPRALLSHNPSFPEAALITLHLLGAFGPAAAALIVTRIHSGPGSIRKLFAPYLHWRAGAGWYALVLLFRPSIWSAALALHLLLSRQPFQFQPVDWGFFAAYLLSQPLVVGVGEELGWMGFAYPWLRARYRFFASGLLLGVIWGLWHLPMFFTAGDSQFGTSLILFVVKLTALRLVMALAFEATHSLLMPALFHVSMNTLSELVPLSPNDPLAVALLILVAAGMVVTYHVRFDRRSTDKDDCSKGEKEDQ